MKMQSKLLMLIATIAFGVAPTLALAHGNGDHGQSSAHRSAHHTSTPGPNASPSAKAKAYGKNCQGQSKKHVAGTPGTPFSKCVTDMAKLAKGSNTNPRTACANESKKHVAGTPGTPYSQCVSSGAKLLKTLHKAQ